MLKRCRPGVNDIRCKIQDKLSEPYAFIFEEALQTQTQMPQPPRPASATTVARGQTRLQPTQSETEQNETVPRSSRPAGVAKSTQDSLTDEQVAKAKLSRASSIFDKEGYEAAQKYLNDNNLDYTVDFELSNDSGIVLIDNNTGKAVVAYRGTDILQPRDWVTGLNILSSNESTDDVFIKARTQMQEVIAEYGPPEELTGFSRGGTIAMTLGNEFNVKTTTFNPFINKTLATSLEGDHTIIRTTTDPISVAANVPNPTFKVVQVHPKGNSLNPITNHELNQFLDTTNRKGPPIEKLQGFVESTGKAQSELITVKEMTQALDQGKSFSEFLSDFSPADIRNGTLSTRIFEGSNFTSLWRDSGGDFSAVEQAHLATSPKGSTSMTGTTSQHRTEFSKLSPSEQEIKIAEISEVHGKAVEQFSRAMQPEEQVQQLIEKPSVLTEQLSAVSLGAGLLGGYIGQKITEKLDPQAALTAQGDEALSGFLGGGLGAVIAGGAALPAAIAGSAGVLAGVETTRALEKAGVGKVGSSTIGGTVGGVAASVVGVGAAAAAAALTGGEIGSVLAPETFGVSIAVGAAIGGLAGLVSSLYNEAFGDTPAPPPPVYTGNTFSRGTVRRVPRKPEAPPGPQAQPEAAPVVVGEPVAQEGA